MAWSEWKKFSGKPTKTQTVTQTVNNAYVTFTFDELTEVVGVIEVTGISQSTNIADFYIDTIVGNTIQVKTYRNMSANVDVTVTAIGY